MSVPPTRTPKRFFGRWTRFEQRILLVFVGCFALALAAGVVAGQVALESAYGVGINERFGGALRDGLDARRRQVEAMRDSSLISHELIEADSVLRVALTEADEGEIKERSLELLKLMPLAVSMRIGERTFGETRKAAELQSTEFEVAGEKIVLVELVPRRELDGLQSAGELVELHDRLRTSAEHVSGIYVWIYAIFVLILFVVAAALSIWLVRRMTRQVGILVGATERVAAGDLSVSVSSKSRDELGDLTSAFNEMVRAVRDSRARVRYLERIGAWQGLARRLAHEIKNPLTPILLAAQEIERSYAAEDKKFPQKLEDGVDIIREEVDALRRLVSEFSSFARLPQATMEIGSLAELLADLRRAIPAILLDESEKEIDVEIAECTNDASLRIDAMLMRRALDNLARNAVQAIDGSAASAGIVRIHSLTASDSVQIVVEDSGPGIAENERESVFDAYFTTKSTGTGLGLPIVKKIVLEHGGEINVDSSELGGAAVSVTLPRSAAKIDR